METGTPPRPSRVLSVSAIPFGQSMVMPLSCSVALLMVDRAYWRTRKSQAGDRRLIDQDGRVGFIGRDEVGGLNDAQRGQCGHFLFGPLPDFPKAINRRLGGRDLWRGISW